MLQMIMRIIIICNMLNRDIRMFSLNAWFERYESNLELRNNYTNMVVLRLCGEELCEVLQDYGLVYTDLLENYASEELIKSLLLVAIKDRSKSWKARALNTGALAGSNIIKFPTLKKTTCTGSCCEVNYENVIYMDSYLTDVFKRA